MEHCRDLLQEVRALGDRFADREAADPSRYPAESIAELIGLRLFVAPFPAELGGRDLSAAEAVTLVEALAQASPSLALLVSMPLGFALMLTWMAPRVPDVHQARFQEQLASIAAEYGAGKIYAACSSERGAGGSYAATKTTASPVEGGGYRLSGEKILASFGRHADVFISTAKLPDGTIESFLVDSRAPGVQIGSAWDGFGMASTESQPVHYSGAPARELIGYPGFTKVSQGVSWWACLFAAVPLGCAAAMLRALAVPAPSSPAVRMRYSESLMRYEAARAYLLDTAARARSASTPELGARVVRTKTYVSQEAVRICADLFALSGGRHYGRTSRPARVMADVFAGTALRPPLPLALDLLIESFSLPEPTA